MLVKVALRKDKEEQMYVFLFSDMLLFSKTKRNKKTGNNYTYKTRLPLRYCTVGALEESEIILLSSFKTRQTPYEFCFKVLDKSKSATKPDPLIFQAASVLDKKSWLNDLDQTVKDAAKK